METGRVRPGAPVGLGHCFPWPSLSRALPGTTAIVFEIREMEIMLLGLYNVVLYLLLLALQVFCNLPLIFLHFDANGEEEVKKSPDASGRAVQILDLNLCVLLLQTLNYKAELHLLFQFCRWLLGNQPQKVKCAR